MRWGVIGVLLLLTGWIGYLMYAQEWQKTEWVTGVSSEARKDPFLVVNRLLADRQPHALRKSTLADVFDDSSGMPDATHTGLVIDARSIVPYSDEEHALLQWVERGGALVYLLSDSGNDAQDTLFRSEIPVYALDTDVTHRTHRDLNVEPDTNAYLLDESIDPLLKLYIPYELRLKGCNPELWAVMNKALQPLLCDIDYGAGRVTFAVTLDFLGNYGIFQRQNATLAVWLLSRKPQHMYIGRISEAGIFGKIWSWSALFVVLGGVWFGLLMWHLASRFGPALVPRFDHYNHFGLHIEALGRFYCQNDLDHKLQTAIRDDIEARMEKFAVNFRQLDDTAKSTVIKQKRILSESAHIDLLFRANLPEDLELRSRYVQSMQTLRNQL